MNDFVDGHRCDSNIMTIPVRYVVSQSWSFHRHQNIQHLNKVSLHQLSGTLCLHLLKVPPPSPHSRHIWKQNCSLLRTTQSNISSVAGASDSNSRHTAPPINVFDIDIDIGGYRRRRFRWLRLRKLQRYGKQLCDYAVFCALHDQLASYRQTCTADALFLCGSWASCKQFLRTILFSFY